jgi:hypothetical protein
MYFLGIDFIISSTLWLVVVFVFMFVFRKHIFKFYYKKTNLDKFLLLLKQDLKETYPKFDFHFDFIKTLKNEPNPDAFKYSVIDNIINQYITFKFILPNKIESIPPNKLWSSYAFNSKPNKNKLPQDWLQRKALVFQRDNKTCRRCSKKISIQQSDIFLKLPIDKGGQYYFENLLLFCTDCIKIENYKQNPTSSIKFLNIKNELMGKISKR